MTLIAGKEIYPGVDEGVAIIQAKGTINNLIDALVELVTNSDDSYLIQEQEGKKVSGKIEILIRKG